MLRMNCSFSIKCINFYRGSYRKPRMIHSFNVCKLVPEYHEKTICTFRKQLRSAFETKSPCCIFFFLMEQTNTTLQRTRYVRLLIRLVFLLLLFRHVISTLFWYGKFQLLLPQNRISFSNFVLNWSCLENNFMHRIYYVLVAFSCYERARLNWIKIVTRHK